MTTAAIEFNVYVPPTEDPASPEKVTKVTKSPAIPASSPASV